MTNIHNIKTLKSIAVAIEKPIAGGLTKPLYTYKYVSVVGIIISV